MSTPFQNLAEIGVIPVIAIDDAASALPLADALLEGGIRCAEITFRTTAARESIEIMTRRRPELIVGAGTLLNIEHLRVAREAGATFGLAPGFDRPVVEAAITLDFPFAPGVMTPSEIGTALSAGLRTMKFFPAGAAGGTKMLSAVEAPYSHLEPRFIPTGGVTLANMHEWLAVPSVLAVGGTWLATRDAIARGAWQEIADACRAAIGRVAEIRGRSAR
ncbi:MAG: bifunctional 4-hydroxy-2-oxoglutarate aldolase/2-dehydro-3-deoxy-phosphogluconate aldolase [Propionivibrio sp.]